MNNSINYLKIFNGNSLLKKTSPLGSYFSVNNTKSKISSEHPSLCNEYTGNIHEIDTSVLVPNEGNRQLIKNEIEFYEKVSSNTDSDDIEPDQESFGHIIRNNSDEYNRLSEEILTKLVQNH